MNVPTMLSQLRTNISSWWHQTPLPPPTITTTLAVTAAIAPPKFQQWQEFDKDRWIPLSTQKPSQSTTHGSIKHQWSGTFRLVTWNVNADSAYPKSRICALLQVLKTMEVLADVIFLQEVSRDALTGLLAESWVREKWYLSDVDTSSFSTFVQSKKKFTTITLISRNWIATSGIQLGAIWRVALPSRFRRDALCCDVLVNSSSSSSTNQHNSGRKAQRIRLVNVHLDSLQINPSLRPSQLAICTKYLGAAGCGIIAGDFNPVMEEDEELVAKNGLSDAWVELYPGDPGYTWGVYAGEEQTFPPGRFDKVAMLGVRALGMGILETRELGEFCGGKEEEMDGRKVDAKEHFSDHFGVLCDVGWEEDRT